MKNKELNKGEFNYLGTYGLFTSNDGGPTMYDDFAWVDAYLHPRTKEIKFFSR